MRIKVAVAVIFDKQQRLLITRRPLDKSYGGYWEFPGGKLEVNEEPQAALARELQEEIGLEVIASRYLGDILHDYVESQVYLHLIVFAVLEFIGEPVCREQQPDLRWVTYDELADYQFPEANLKIIKLLKREEFYT